MTATLTLPCDPSDVAPAGHLPGSCLCLHPACVAADIAYVTREERLIEAAGEVDCSA